MNYNYRELCADLADRLQRAITWPQADCFYGEDRDALDRARIALAEPETDRKTIDYRRGREDGMSEGYLRGEADARTALSLEGAGVGPTDEDLLKTYGKARREFCYEGPTDDWPKREERASTVAGLRAVLARYGTTHPRPIPLPQDSNE